MPTFRRTVAALLLVLYLPACHHYVPLQETTPQEYIAAKHPKQVRVTLEDGTRQTILHPSTSHDSLLGYIPVRQSNNYVRSGPPWAASLGSVRRLEVYKLNTGATVGATVGGVLLAGAAVGLMIGANSCWGWGC